jgi:hypothetical protein
MTTAKQRTSHPRYRESGQDRRRYQRYQLRLPSRVYSQADLSQPHVFLATTRDISSRGAYLATSQPLSANEPVRLELTIPLSRNDQQETRGSILISSGYVIRQDKAGMAVKFHDFQIFPLLDKKQN